jgi:hypothetical protein
MKIAKGGVVLRKELQDITYLEAHPEACELFKNVGCYRFFQKLQGYHQGITEAFAKIFDGVKIQLGPVLMQIDEVSIETTTKIPGEGEKWFKTTSVKEINFRPFLKKEHQNMKWQQEIPRSYLEDKWQELLKIIQVYITCEGRYGRTMIYHFRLLLHFTGKKPLNMPYYLLKILTKMASKVQAKPQKASNSLFHHGLIKLIVLEELSRRDKTWGYLLFWGEFEQESQPQGKGASSQQVETPKTSKRKRRALSPVEPVIEASSSKSKKIKRKLEFGKDVEGQRKATTTNILNFPYSDSDSESPAAAIETPEKEIPETSSKKGVSKQPKVHKLKKELAELQVLERYLKTENETLKKTSLKTGSALDKLAIKYETLKHKNKKLWKKKDETFLMGGGKMKVKE